MSNLFDKSRKDFKDISKKSIDVRIDLGNSFFPKMKMLNNLQTNMKKDKAAADKIMADIKNEAIQKWSELYEENDKNPGAIIIESKNDNDIAEAQFIPNDKYITIDEKKSELLIEKYDEKLISEDDQYIIDPDMVIKYGDVLSELIMNCDQIDDRDKKNIIKLKTSFSIKKGSINNLNKYENSSIQEIVEDISPIFVVRDLKIKENV